MSPNISRSNGQKPAARVTPLTSALAMKSMDFDWPSPGSIKGRASSITAAFIQAIVLLWSPVLKKLRRCWRSLECGLVAACVRIAEIRGQNGITSGLWLLRNVRLVTSQRSRILFPLAASATNQKVASTGETGLQAVRNAHLRRAVSLTSLSGFAVWRTTKNGVCPRKLTSKL